jgi:Tol biopolymer transport system component
LEDSFQDFNIIDPEWFPGGLKIIFVSDKDDKAGEIYTIWKDGSHLERLTNDSLIIKNPVVSPTLKYMAVSVLVDGGFDLFVIPLEDY